MDRYNPEKKYSGFSLVESLFVAAILAILFGITTHFFVQSSQIWQTTNLESDLRYSARKAIEDITRDLRFATRTAPNFPLPPNLSIPPRPDNYNMTFYLPQDLDGNGLIINSIGSTEWNITSEAKIEYQYIPALKVLQRVQGNNTTIVARDVTNVELEDHGINNALYNDELRVILSLSNATPLKRQITVTLSSIIKLRNK